MNKDIEMKNLSNNNKEDKKEENNEDKKKSNEEELKDYIQRMKAEAQNLTYDLLKSRIKALESQTINFKSDYNKMKVDIKKFKARIKENKEKLKISTGLPHLISSISEIFDLEQIDNKDEGSGLKEDSKKNKQQKGVIIKTTTRSTIFLPVIGLVEPEELHPLELVGCNKDTYLIYEKLPNEYDSRVRVMELDTKPSEKYTDLGGVDKQIKELEEAIVLPIEKKHLFDAIGIQLFKISWFSISTTIYWRWS